MNDQESTHWEQRFKEEVGKILKEVDFGLEEDEGPICRKYDGRSRCTLFDT
jgi:hypothetical protein